MIKAVILIILLLIIAFGLFIWRARKQWHAYTAARFETITHAVQNRRGNIDLSETDTLPEPVRKYFRLALRDGAPLIRTAKVTQLGGFRAKPEMKGWSPMRAEQLFSIHPKAFAWNASIAMLPGININVCDSYIDGRGAMKGNAAALIDLIDVHDQKELNAGALQRYLAESVWFPTALLPSSGVTWTAMDAHRARATLTEADTTVSLEFGFNDLGEIVSVYAPARYREVEGRYVPTPWQGTFSDYFEVDGYRIPRRGAVEWHLKDGVYPYWKAELKTVEFN